MAAEYGVAQLTGFLERLDAALSAPARSVVIGGAALALGYGVPRGTRDIDVISADPAVDAALEALASSGVAIPVERVGVYDAPHSFEDRLRELPMPSLNKLKVRVPEAHDLVLMKLARGDARDIDGIQRLHQVAPLSLETLVARYREMLPGFIGRPMELKLNFLEAVELLFGGDEAKRLDGELAPP